jgi:hypothetical protein
LQLVPNYGGGQSSPVGGLGEGSPDLTPARTPTLPIHRGRPARQKSLGTSGCHTDHSKLKTNNATISYPGANTLQRGVDPIGGVIVVRDGLGGFTIDITATEELEG